ncbi:TPA: DUF1120 domain-containing protein [Enterobacter hormaechei]|uniref:DUF1120 domain-containing protein n=1 Tax=Enterobacter hormaechei TaxID=158836 RepID=UPI00288A95B7|nr:DUF1120 domain-containing protein [Enterobacter hormaechei]EKS6649074.1 DUF1120 domain-containing protein [Enterobacter hormaechei]WNJ35456.1 DUF1120 domain-containing protein [Enterobacter hormaechei subsp. hormaechei]HDR1956816.1 DUF1120 domain-containing protein [Enterobacter hormaechei]
MKKSSIAAAIFCAAFMTTAHAAETAVLKLTGTLTNSACTPELSNGGIADFGYIRTAELSATQTNQIGKRDITLTINCQTKTQVGWSIVDNRADSLPSPFITVDDAAANGDYAFSASSTFGVGKTPGGVNIGAYAVYADLPNVTGNGIAVDVLYHAGGSSTWAKSTTGRPTIGVDVFTVTNKGEKEPIAFTEAVFPLKVVLAVQATDKLSITDDAPLDGQATISLAYL